MCFSSLPIGWLGGCPIGRAFGLLGDWLVCQLVDGLGCVVGMVNVWLSDESLH